MIVSMHKRAYKFRIFPTKSQITILSNVLDECRWVYNKTLEYRKEKWEKEKLSISKYETYKLLPEWKQERKSLNDVYSQIFQDVQERVDLAFRNFFRRIKCKEKPGYPRFKSKNRYDSFTYPQITSNIKFVDDNKLHLPKIGAVRIKRHRPIEGKIKRLTLWKSPTNKWFIIFSVETEPVFLPKNNKSVGIDVGLKNFATFSNGHKIQNPRFLKREEKALAKAQRKHSKDKNEKTRKVVARVYERVGNKRHNFIHQESKKIIDKYGTICLEKLNVENMKQRNKENHKKSLNKSIQDVAWRYFFNALIYKAEDAGRSCVQIDPAYTSKTCSKCGKIKLDLTLKQRVYECNRCGLKLDRDKNAAINILRLGLQSLDRKVLKASSSG